MKTRGVLGACVVAGGLLAATAIHCSSETKADAGPDGAADTGPAGDAGVPCDDAGCPNGLTCCSSKCVSLKSVGHCGSCGSACAAGQFCTGSACKDSVLSNLCEDPKATLALDGLANDDDAGGILGASLAGCDAGITLRTVLSADAGGVLGAGGQPALGGGDTLVTAGGPYFQPPVQYMETSLTSIFVQVVNNGNQVQVIERKTQNKIVDQPVTALTATHDFFLVQMAVEPTTSTLAFMGYGLYSPGTAAMAWYVKNTLVPGRASYTDRWYVYEWTDADMSGGPSANDTWTKVASGK